MATAAATCDGSVDPGSVNATCNGKCEVTAEAAASCTGDATLKCEGTAPGLDCGEFSCTGSCQLTTAASCSGTCNGSCTEGCTVCLGGECDEEDGIVANCAGACEGDCEGECQLEAGGECEGDCAGSCEYDAVDGSCQAGASMYCEASAEASFECEGSCDGEVVPPDVSVECKASAEAKAKADVSCTPPSLAESYQFSVGADLGTKAEFQAWLQAFESRYAAMVAHHAKLVGPTVDADIGLRAAIGDLGVAAEEVVELILEMVADGDLSLQRIIGLECALDQAKDVGAAREVAGSEVQVSVSAFASISAAVGGTRGE